MSLTPNQKQRIIECHETLKNRGIVYFSGRQNGKTKLIQTAQETSTVENGSRVVLRSRHPEDNDIEFITNGFYGRADKISPYTYMRQVMIALDRRPGNGFWEVAKKFEDLLWEFHQERRVLVIAVDNAELLPERAFTILKQLSEIRKNKRDIGTGILLAGEFGKMRMPIPFLKRCHEIEVGKIEPADVALLIQTHYPGHASSFDEKAILSIWSNCDTTLEVRHNLDKVIRAKRRLDEDKVTEKLVHIALAA